MGEPTGLWMYAVTPGGLELEHLNGLEGVGGGEPRAVEAAGLVAVVEAVPLTEFGEEALHHNLENLSWLEKVARAHDAVIAAVTKDVSAVPLRLATVCLDDDRVRAILKERSAEFSKALRLIEGRSEWGLRAHLRRADDTSGTTAGSTGQAKRSSGTVQRGAGAAYLQRRRTQLTARQEAERAAAEAVNAVHQELCKYAVGARRQPPPSQQLTGTAEPVLLNGTYLVDQARTGDFLAAVEEMQATSPALRLVLTGPWPPYSFTAAAQATVPTTRGGGEQSR
ncbi:GvpL/GvpF family gas vesicle protein [Hoyosella subflava]|nr:GvpL/GvpF family gas vesicle protein [Hoyosella subflava]